MNPKLAALTALAAAMLAACHHEAPPPPPPTPVVALGVTYDRDAATTSPYPVEAAPRYSTAMSFRVAGKLLERRVRLGDHVTQGQVLARLDAVDAERQAAAAQAAFESADHRLLFARQQLERDEAQAKANLISATQLEQTQDAHASALAARTQAQEQWVIARNTRGYFTLVADHEGLISSENADTGQVLSAGQAVYGLAWTGDTDVIVDAGAADLSNVSVNQPATVVFNALPERHYAAKVREIAPSADPQNRTYRIKLTLQGAPAEVRFGMTGEARFAPVRTPGTSDRPLATIPSTALFHQGKAPAVWVIRKSDSSLELRRVEVSRYRERTVVIVGGRAGDAGLEEGEQIVAAGVHTVFAGQHVDPVKPLYSSDAP